MTLLVPAVKERIDKGERENAAEERRLAGLARDDQATLLQLHQEELKIRAAERKAKRKRDLGKWLLGGSSQITESNHRHQERNLKIRSPETCTWLKGNNVFEEWLNGSTSVVCVNAAPGVGKSVLAAYAIELVQHNKGKPRATCFQYYTFDDKFSEVQVLRSLAEQLANSVWESVGDIPEDIHSLSLGSTSSSRAEDIKSMIRMLYMSFLCDTPETTPASRYFDATNSDGTIMVVLRLGQL